MQKRRSASKRPPKKGSSTKAPPKAVRGSEAGLVIGRQRFVKISAVEGIILDERMTARAAEFERQGASPEERRSAIIRAYRKG
jgi:hypothetical protein